jgi:mono/diheme cytochrome c family protein
LFALDGTLPPVQPGSPISRQAAVAAPPAAPGERSVRQPDVAAGRQLYAQACEVCHGADGAGGHGGGASLVALKDLAGTIQTVTAGRNNMPPFSASFTPEQIRDVSAYVVGTLAGRSVP